MTGLPRASTAKAVREPSQGNLDRESIGTEHEHSKYTLSSEQRSPTANQTTSNIVQVHVSTSNQGTCPAKTDNIEVSTHNLTTNNQSITANYSTEINAIALPAPKLSATARYNSNTCPPKQGEEPRDTSVNTSTHANRVSYTGHSRHELPETLMKLITPATQWETELHLESQIRAECAVHAINNALQGPVVNRSLLNDAVVKVAEQETIAIEQHIKETEKAGMKVDKKSLPTATQIHPDGWWGLDAMLEAISHTQYRAIQVGPPTQIYRKRRDSHSEHPVHIWPPEIHTVGQNDNTYKAASSALDCNHKERSRQFHPDRL
jgi:hypothetical protein